MEELQPNGPVPLYYQIELSMRKRIDSGELRAGEVLPSEHDLASELGVSRITIRKALDRLEEDGLIMRRRGKRTTVAKVPPPYSRYNNFAGDFRGLEDELRDRGFSPHATVLEIVEGTAPDHVVTALHLDQEEKIVRIRRVGAVESVTVWTESRYFPLEIGRRLGAAALAHESVLTALDRSGCKVASVEMRIDAVSANSFQASLLGIGVSDPLLLHQSIAFTEDHTPVQLTRVYLRADLYSLTLDAKPQPGFGGLNIVGGGYLVGFEAGIGHESTLLPREETT